MSRYRKIGWRTFSALSSVIVASIALPTQMLGLELDLPLTCVSNGSCVVQQYPDVVPGPKAADYHCGTLSYDAHDGTDFRLPDLRPMRRGVPVLAVASGIVKATRDGMSDRFRNAADNMVLGRECGNGVIIDHGGGWQTQYCHLRRGSVRVRPGTTVRRRQPIGLVGLSGDTEFPHLHLTVRHGTDVIDPFTGLALGAGCAAKPHEPLWSSTAEKALAYRPTSILNIGFATAPVTSRGIEQGAYDGSGNHLPADADVLVFYVRVIGLQKGDVGRLILKGPAGEEIARGDDIAPRVQAQRFSYAGRKRPGGGWPSGRYTGHYQLIRGDRVVLDRTVTAQIP